MARRSEACSPPPAGWLERGPIAIPEPPVRPDRHAQWDEVHGCWIRWDAEAEAWVAESQPLVIDLREQTA